MTDDADSVDETPGSRHGDGVDREAAAHDTERVENAREADGDQRTDDSLFDEEYDTIDPTPVEQRPPYDPNEIIEAGSIDAENALFVIVGVLAMVGLFVHVAELLV
ncbi:DUF7312 domain-containing protein [Haloarchaeobius sp. DFWS5]|uniref:DUF7312 domain-containing protein n=1 Tax=Haloarchaeobius sp. DFWS5 TaxID=3446114 RepID=UPI003EBDD254